MPTPLNPSPLAIRAHEFLEIHLEATDCDDPDAPLTLDFNRKWGQSENDPLDWMAELTVRFGGEGDDDKVPYRGVIRAAGYFRIAKAYPEQNRETLIKVTGASILYGACREMLANLTARSSHGMISLPSVSFIERKRPVAKKAATKAAKRKS
ncbi:MAG: protein-export chaperone SecB [Akkermansiaceae bacterium]|nr:protein-export chaperone SecB [Akkermansiaceae bacterium]